MPIAEGVSQISPPIRVLLVAALAFLALWMTVLKPKPTGVTPAAPSAAGSSTAPGVAGLGRAVEKAEGAKATQEAADGRLEGATGDDATPASGTAPGVRATPGARTGTGTGAAASSAGRAPRVAPVAASVLARLPKTLRKAVARHHVVVLGVVNPGRAPFAAMPPDDRALRRELRHVARDHGRVAVRTVALPRLSRYAAIASGAQVVQSPAVIVVDGKLRATRLDGFSDRHEIDQAVLDAQEATDPGLVGFKQRANHLCARYATWMGRSHSRAERVRVSAHYHRAFARLAAPPARRALQRRIVARLAGAGAGFHALDRSFAAAGLDACRK